MKKINLYVFFILLMVSCARSNSDDLINPMVAITNTPIPQITNTVVLTPDPIKNQTAEPDIAAVLSSIAPFRVYQKYPSPDGSLEIRIDIIDCTEINGIGEVSLEQMITINQDTKVEAEFYTQTINCGGLGEYGLKGLFWSDNSRYFYFTNARQGSPDGCCEFYYRNPIIRLSVDNGALTTLGMGVRSPDKRSLVTWAYEDIVISDIEQGSEVHFSRLDDQLGIASIAWSPDSKNLAYLQVDSLFVPKHSRLVLISLSDSGQTEIALADLPVFIDLEWPENDELFLMTVDDQKWVYNLSSDNMKSIN